MPESSRLLVGCRREDYSASRIAHAVEDCNAHLLNLNVTSLQGEDMRHADGYDPEEYADAKFPVVFDIRVSHRDAAGIARSLERYGYTVLEAQNAAGVDDETLRDRLEMLFKYLEP